MEKTTYYEIQKFRQKWLWVLILSIMSFAVYTMIVEKPVSHFGNNIHLFAEIACFISLLLVWFARLETKINEHGIQYRFLPFHFKFHEIKWSEIKKCYVRHYDPILEYGGWGMRLGLFGKGKAYNTMGDQGLQIELNSGKKILFGTQTPEELERAIGEFFSAPVS